MDKNDWEMIKTITESEHHFNNLCFKIRTLASTWLLATFVGVGFLLTKTIALELRVEQIIVMLCWIGTLGILVLWVLDLRIYQKLLSVWFNSREPIEARNSDFPQIREGIKKSQPGGSAFNLLKLFYLALCSAPLLFSFYISIDNNLPELFLYGSLFLFVLVVFIIILFSKEK